MTRRIFLPCVAGDGNREAVEGATAHFGARVAPSVTARIRAAPPPPRLWRRGGRSHLAVVPLLLTALALGGCVTVLPKAKPVQLYRFGVASAAALSGVASVGPGGARGLILADVSLPRAAQGDGILTIDGDSAAYVGGARWLEPAVAQFEADAQAAFAARAKSVALLDHGQASVASGLLRLDVTRFETRYGEGEAPVVLVRMRATLERPDGRGVLTRAFEARQPAGADRVTAIVAAYDTAVGQVLTELVDWTDAAAPTLDRPASPAP